MGKHRVTRSRGVEGAAQATKWEQKEGKRLRPQGGRVKKKHED